MNLAFLTFYVHDLTTTSTFWRALGFDLTEEKHGKGPTHYSFQLGKTTLEIYPCSTTETPTNRILLGIETPTYDTFYTSAAHAGAKVKRNTSSQADGTRSCILITPDGWEIYVQEVK